MTALAAITARGAALPPATVEGRPRGHPASANQRGGPFSSGSDPPPPLSSPPLGAVPTQPGASSPKPRPIYPDFAQRQAAFFRCANPPLSPLRRRLGRSHPWPSPSPLPSRRNRHFLMPVPSCRKLLPSQNQSSCGFALTPHTDPAFRSPAQAAICG